MREPTMMPWYGELALVEEGRKSAEKTIDELENPKKQFVRLKSFYSSLGADYTRNKWMQAEEKNLGETDWADKDQLDGLKREVRFSKAVEAVLVSANEESIKELCVFREDSMYKSLVRKILFYIGISKIEEDGADIERAYEGIIKQYPYSNRALFLDEGVYYYKYYIQCLGQCLRNHKEKSTYIDIASRVQDRILNMRLSANAYIDDIYIGAKISEIIMSLNELQESM